ncbi:MAG TPA: FAD-dependent oxidoreductase [Salinimicrobium sp.]|nr:FAD-dependent oxidoreductase [Salinimicrobium sp.]
MIDYILVGLGLGGISIAQEFRKRKKTFLVYEDNSQQASTVAGGIINPVNLKRFTLAWEVKNHLNYAIPFYEEIQKELDFSFLKKIEVYRRFSSIEEQNNWFLASDKTELQNLLDPNLVKEINPHIKADYCFGKINNTAILQTNDLIFQYKKMLSNLDLFLTEKFDHSKLKIDSNFVQYNGIKAKSIVFCEGFGMKSNPFFNNLPLIGNKGEYIIIQAPNLKLDVVVKSSVFIIPLGNDTYKIGATYRHGDYTSSPTTEIREILEKQVKELLSCDFEIIDQEAAIRPATIDRKPLLGRHPSHKNLYICNGFGSRGISMAPSLAKDLLDFMEEKKPLDPEINIERFSSDLV